MRIAVYHNLPTGGGKRALYEMTRHLSRRHELDVYTLSCAAHDFCDVRPCCNQHIVFPFQALPLAKKPFGRVNQLIRITDLLRLRQLQRNIARAIDQAGYDMVFAHNCQFSQSPGLLSFLNTPSVYYCGEPPRQVYEPAVKRDAESLSLSRKALNKIDPFPPAYRRMLKNFDYRSARAATRVLVNSHYSRETAYRVYGFFARVRYLGVDCERFQPLNLPRENFVLSVGQLSPSKGFDFLIRSLALIDDFIKPSLIVVSNLVISSEQKYLQALAKTCGVKVSFRPGVSDEELVSLYNRALLTIYSPIMEPFGFVPLESMACGTPVVGVREAGVRESVPDGKAGVLTERDERAFAAAITSLLRDENKRKSYGDFGSEYVKSNWSWEGVTDALEMEFADIATGGKR